MGEYAECRQKRRCLPHNGGNSFFGAWQWRSGDRQRHCRPNGIRFVSAGHIREIADRADIGASVIESIEKEHLSGIEDFIATLVSRRYLWPEIYLEQLMKVVSVIGKHGMAVIIGRGANFILPPNERLSIRIVAPVDLRVLNFSRLFNISEEEARKRVIVKEAKRRAFVRKSFNADIADPINYDLTFNTEFIRYEASMEVVQQILKGVGKSG